MDQHLDWMNREPTYFISFFDNPEDALNEAERRLNRGQMPAYIRIAEVNKRLLDAAVAFYFSTLGLISMLRIPRNHQLRYSLNQREWFVMEYVPSETVVEVYDIQQLGHRVAVGEQ